jgi:3-oxoacyl-[acyl-carrier-protein] synthase-1
MRLSIVGRGAINAVGLSALQSCSAIRAGISGYRESDFFHDSLEIQPIIAANVPKSWADEEEPADRIISMAAAALSECLETSAADPARTAVLLGWRESFREELELPSGTDLLDHLQGHMHLRFHPESRIVPEGNAATFAGLSLADELLASRSVDLCMVGGVDSYLNAFDLTFFETNYRLLSPTVSRGFVPGEGAAFVAVREPSASSSRPFLSIRGVGLAREDNGVTVLSEGHPTGAGLVNALKDAEARSGIPESRVSFRVSDLNGESYRGIESMLSQARYYRTRRERLALWHPADCIGETGAGVGALLLILAEYGVRKGFAPGPVAMCECSSDSGLRAACVVESEI